MTHTCLESLQNLLRVALEIRDKKLGFNMGFFISGDRDCNTVACLAGWSTLDPWFAERGLYLSPQFGDPVYGNQLGFDALQDFFRLSTYDCQRIFFHSPKNETDIRPKIDQVIDLILRVEYGQ